MKSSLRKKGLVVLCAAVVAGCGADQETTSAPEVRTASSIVIGAPTYAFSGPLANYTINVTASGVLVTDKTGVEAPVTLASNSRIKFADQSLSFDVNGQAGQLYRLYQAAFGRTPDAAGLGYWLDVLDRGTSLNDVASGFIGSAEFTSLFGASASLSNAAMIDAFYRNVLGRAGEQAGVDYWVGVLNGGVARNVVLMGFTDSAENRTRVDPTIQNGIQYFAPGMVYTGIAAASKMSLVSQAPVTANLGATVNLPGVLVQDAAGNPLANIKVDFAVGANHGSLASTSALTNASGIAAAPAWTLGAAPGTQAITASVAGGLRTRLEATGTLPSGCVSAPAAVGFSYNGAWTSGDCVSSTTGQHYDEYTFVTTGQTNFKMNLAGHQGRQFVVLDNAGRFITEMPSDAFAPAAGESIELRYALPAGTYKLRASAKDAASLGNYTLKLSDDFATTISNKTICSPIVFTTYGAVIEQSLSVATSCSFMGDVEDRYVLIMQQGETVELKIESAAFGPFLGLRDDRSPTAPMLESDAIAAPGTLTISHTATFSGFHEIIVASGPTKVGAYKLTVVKK